GVPADVGPPSPSATASTGSSTGATPPPCCVKRCALNPSRPLTSEDARRKRATSCQLAGAGSGCLIRFRCSAKRSWNCLHAFNPRLPHAGDLLPAFGREPAERVLDQDVLQFLRGTRHITRANTASNRSGSTRVPSSNTPGLQRGCPVTVDGELLWGRCRCY